MKEAIVFGANHTNTLGVIRGLGRAGIKTILLLQNCNLDDCFLNASKYISRFHLLNSDVDAIKILLEHYSNPQSKMHVICTSDAAIHLLDKNYNRLSKNFVLFNANNEEGRISYYLDKINTFPLAEKAGLDIIRTWHINNKEKIIEDITYPCLTKPNSSLRGEKADMVVCHNQEELRKTLVGDKDFLVQQYIEKDYELNVIGVSFEHGKKVLLPAAIRKIRDYMQWQSMYMRLDDIKEYPLLKVDSIKKFVQLIGYEGMFSVEFLYKEGKYYLLEINLRSDGCNYLYTRAGINFPYLWVEYSTNPQMIDTAQIIPNVPFYIMNEFDVYDVFHKRVTLCRWLKDVFTTDAFFIWDKSDPKPFWCWLKQLSGRVVHRFLRSIFKR